MNKKIDEKTIYFAKLNENARIPNKKLEDAGYDIYACFDKDFFVIEPFKTKPIPTGIAAAFSNKYYIQVEERSSMGKIGIKKSAGVMDSGYRGEYLILTYNTNEKPFVISKLDKEELEEEFEIDGKVYKKDEVILYPYTKAVAQLVLQEIPVVETKEISYDELKSIVSERGTGRFGSSGK